jgi:hypothetical protein
MNRGLNFYGIILVTIATLVFSLNDFGVVHATTGIDLDNNAAQSNQVPDLKSDPNDNDKSSSSSNNNDDNNNDDNNNDDKSSSSSNNNDDNNNDDKSSSSSNNNDDKSSTSPTITSPTTASSTSPTITSPTTASSSGSNDNVPMSLPFNSNMADESDDEKDYSSIIPFP